MCIPCRVHWRLAVFHKFNKFHCPYFREKCSLGFLLTTFPPTHLVIYISFTQFKGYFGRLGSHCTIQSMFDYFDRSTLASLQEIPNCYFQFKHWERQTTSAYTTKLEVTLSTKFLHYVWLRFKLKIRNSEIVLSQNVFNFWELDFFFVTYVKVTQVHQPKL